MGFLSWEICMNCNKWDVTSLDVSIVGHQANLTVMIEMLLSGHATFFMIFTLYAYFHPNMRHTSEMPYVYDEHIGAM